MYVDHSGMILGSARQVGCMQHFHAIRSLPYGHDGIYNSHYDYDGENGHNGHNDDLLSDVRGV